MAMSSYDYWKKREDLNRKNQVKDQKRREAWLRDTYEDMMKSCTDQIEAFYARYAHRNGITIAEARKRVAELDIKAYSRKARKYVKEKDFSETANEEMALYNLTMKVNRLEMLKAQMNLELTAGFDSVDKYFKGELRDAALDEYKRMAGILGKTVQNPTRRAESLVNASFKNATFSQRIWQHHNALINTLSIELTNALIQGKHPRDLAKIVASKFGVYRYAAERLMITEVARVQTGAQKEAYERNGYGKYVFITEAKPCPDCARLAGQQFKLKDMQPGENAPPMHPICRCSTAAAMDQDEFEKWLAGKEEDRKMLSRGEAEAIAEINDAESYGEKPETDIDYEAAHNFASGDTRLVNALLSGKPGQVCNAVEEILNKKAYDLPKSRWSGKTHTAKVEDMPLALGRKEYNCDITIREDQGYNAKVYIHENLHARSISAYPERQRKDVFKEYKSIEEGTVEYLSQEICKKSHITFRGSYSEKVNPLRDIKKILRPETSDYEFAKELIEIPLKDRYTYLKEMVKDYMASTPKIRESVKKRLENNLKALSGGG